METRTSVPLVERGILKRTKKRAVTRQQRRRAHWRNAAMAMRCQHQILQSLFQPIVIFVAVVKTTTPSFFLHVAFLSLFQPRYDNAIVKEAYYNSKRGLLQ